MVVILIIFSIMVLKVCDAANVCFDDTPGTIDVSISIPFKTYNWNLYWNWPPILNEQSSSSQVVGASGCAGGGLFRLRTNHKRIPCHFEFVTEVHITCLPGSPFCSFPVTVYEHDNIWWVRGSLNCNCVPGDALFDDSGANATYSVPTESSIAVENDYSLTQNITYHLL
jgi:hypothetical protein